MYHFYNDILTALPSKTEETKKAREQILEARTKQAIRFSKTITNTNSGMSARDIEQLIPINKEVKDLLKVSSKKLNLSPRSYHRLIKVARTIADLAGSKEIEQTHVLEALQYRVSL